MLDFFVDRKKRINQVLQNFLDRKQEEIDHLMPWGKDVLTKLKPFTANGKMIRGGLVVLAHEMFAGKAEPAALQCGAAMELLQSAFLIHDDVMDQDSLRRGEKTIFRQYADWGREKHLPGPERFGDAMAICVGDVVFFLAFELLNELPVDGEIRQMVSRITLRENAKVGLGQMQDVFFGFLPHPVEEEDIFKVFSCKTATYTFILPLLLGSVLAGRKEEQLTELRDFGESMGVIFQMRDDDLGMFGDESETGKPVGNDIRQGKKTLFHFHLMRKCTDGERRQLQDIFCNPDIGSEKVEWVRELIVKYGIREQLQRQVAIIARSARCQLEKVAMPVPAWRQVLREVVDYSVSRGK